ncbi:ABC transporter substrate-binding protein [Streptomyces sp. H10-C2]|uniref:ABC transporter substrate-binding protein n=1 Tax=unclassified Streptomyces TaxID=2593676 RepID=UPI0024BA8CFF|nr:MULTISPECIES: ABC transporter substrate-binding protein [unclassified Streptomyces]MDJ0343798.1 ABC transporter substrate-binding protein [Streptomyces sp. PH10-H1]MDJ0373319.1 ABC transporter substrate-binding protein [Streptomyces sp. H10-C2]
MNRKLLALPVVVVGLISPVLAGCGSGSGSGADKAIVVGTTDEFHLSPKSPAPLDPVTGYDIQTWNVFYNTFQTLLRFPRSGTDPEPEAAKECHFTDGLGEQYRCTLRDGLQFSNGHALTSKDVKFSIDRMLAIKDENGPYSLLTNVDKVETPDEATVVFHLKDPDATFPYKLATPAADIVDSEVYDAKKQHAGFDMVGSGPYQLESFKEGDSAVFTKNPHYKGTIKLNNSKIELKFFKNSTDMGKALKAGDIDVMNRSMTPAQLNELNVANDKDVKLTEAPGTEIRYLVFNTADPVVKQKAVRQAVAQIVDRQAITRDVYQRTTEPLYSIVPAGITGHANSFYNSYGVPNAQNARKTLRDAGITSPVELTLSYTTEHYGEATAQEFQLLKKQLEATGLFKIKLQGVSDWHAYTEGGRKHQFQVYGMGWFPDFPDPDNYIAPFLDKESFLELAYSNSVIQNQLIKSTRQKTQRSATITDFTAAQNIVATDVPLLPLWQGKQYLAARSDITGTEWTLNASSTTQFWELGRGVTG